jgi:formylglycine-generating enzyme required for sulfatase activity
MSHRTCPTDDQLRAFLTGSASEDELNSTGDHVRTCLSCLGRLERLVVPEDPVLAALRGMPDSSPAAATPADPAYLRALRSLTGAAPDSPPRPAVGPGSVLGEYLLVERLGEGGMGVVWKAVHNRLGKPVALKTIHRRRLGDPASVARFGREMKAVGGLDHPNIVRATDAGEAGGVHFLVMEFVEGVNLSRLVKEHGPLPVREACALIRQAAAGLEYAHAAGLIHRDVKPSNLMRTADGMVKVLDLGLARLAGEGEAPGAADADSVSSPGASDVTSAGQVIGTLHYMAPEQQRDARAVDARADVYGLGATLWFMLTGAPPEGEPRGGGTLPGGLPAAVWEKLLSTDPAGRYPSAAAVAEALAPFAVSPKKSEGNRRAWFVLVAAVVAVGGVAVLGVLQPWRNRGGGPIAGDDSRTDGTEKPPPAARVGELPMTPEEAKALQAACAKEVGGPVELTDRSGMRLALIPRGEFVLSGECRVRISRPYYVGTCEVTNGEFRAFVAATGHESEIESTGGRYFGEARPGHEVKPDRRFNWKTPGHETVTDDRPVTQVSWTDAARFCEWKTRQEGVTYRLPTEVEWLWAARAGNPVTHLPQANREWAEVAWCKMNTTEPQPVGRKRANPWGLHDVFGNVSEWCHDYHDEYPSKKQTLTDWAGPEGHELGRHVFVGTPYMSPIPMRFDFRDSIMEWTGNSYLGFRVVREVTRRPMGSGPPAGRLPKSTAETSVSTDRTLRRRAPQSLHELVKVAR